MTWKMAIFVVAVEALAIGIGWGRSVITNAGMGTVPVACTNIIVTATPNVIVTATPSEVIKC
jgi:hypothetical protein